MAFAMQARMSPNAGGKTMYYAAPGAVDRNMSYIISVNLLVLLPGCRCWRRYLNSCVFVLRGETVVSDRPVLRWPFIIGEGTFHIEKGIQGIEREKAGAKGREVGRGGDTTLNLQSPEDNPHVPKRIKSVEFPNNPVRGPCQRMLVLLGWSTQYASAYLTCMPWHNSYPR
jgi:hypothetical protein